MFYYCKHCSQHIRFFIVQKLIKQFDFLDNLIQLLCTYRKCLSQVALSSSMCNFSAAPSHPYGITLLNCDGHSMTLGWKLPKFTGGSHITGYYIDKREANHLNWHEVNTSLISQRIYKVSKTKEMFLFKMFYIYKSSPGALYLSLRKLQ